MTSIVAWTGVDTHGPASLYIASDSRISWGNQYRWDFGRKTFAGLLRPHIFGYWGDVLFPALALPVVLEKLDRGLLPDAPATEVNILDEVRAMWRTYPRQERRDVGILHGHRRHMGMHAQLSLAILRYRSESDLWSKQDVTLPETSSVLALHGSGRESMQESSARWQASPQADTSRSAFSAFCESIASGRDPYSGGGPQVVGLWRGRGAGQSFGTVADRQPFFAGSVHRKPRGEAVPFFNELFERVDDTGRRIEGAQRHLPR